MKLNTIEASRGIAACLVVAFHATGIVEKYFHSAPLGGLFSFGYTGVDFFFVLSGFIIYTVYAKDTDRPDKLRPFLLKRFVRIFPVYWVVLTAIIPAYLLTHNWDGGQIVKAALLWPQSDSANILSPAWTISYELLFYAIFSLAIVNKRMGIAVFALWQVSVVAANLFGGNHGFLFDIRNLEFLFGIVVAALPRLSGKFSFFVGVGCFLTLGLGGVISPLAYGLSSALIVYGLASMERAPIKLPRAFTLLGAASYSIYLIHAPVLSVLAKILVRLLYLSPNIVFMVLFAASVLIGISFHFLVEKNLLAVLSSKPSIRPAGRIAPIVSYPHAA